MTQNNKNKRKKDPRGGSRPGAGRPKTGKAKEWITCNIQISTFAKLKKLKNERNCESIDSLILAILSEL